ncbi:MAG: hypothetical protein K2R93_05100 [Gemmatimonadaceae bacterium]|nr:hypothetical protein [Gemmatimonadaceae bacterium]
MIRWTIAIAVGLVAAWLAYGRGGSSARAHAWWLAALRALAVTAVAALLVGAPAGRATPLAPLVAVDVSSSVRRASGDDSTAVRAWRTRLADSLSAWSGGGPLVVVGDSVREATSSDLKTWTPSDATSRVRSAVDRAASLGRPLVLVTDGEVDDAESLADAPAGSRVASWPASTKRDVALADLTVPASATGGDSLSVSVAVASGGVATPDGTLQLRFDGTPAGSAAIPALAPYSTTRITTTVVVPRGTAVALVQAVAQVAADVEARNDTLTAAVEVGDRPSAVFVSTAPDLDVREALTVLRGALDVPTKAYLRIAPNVWRVEGSYAPVSEAEVKARAAQAGLLILHGDTTWQGAVTSGDTTARARAAARALWTPAPPTTVAKAGELTRTPEWYANAAPASPLMAALATLPFDSLPPITLAGPATGAQPVLTAQLGKRGAAVAAVATREERGVRTAVVSGSGWAGWSLRGGRSRDAFTALWGALFDWLAAGRGDVRAARPVSGVVRAGEPVLWRRGGADTVVAVQLRKRSAANTTADTTTLTLRFTNQRFEAASPALATGVYDVQAPGGPSVLVVNASREWIPRAPTVTAGPATKAASSSDAPRFADMGWPFVLALLLLCAEWVGRRLAGHR